MLAIAPAHSFVSRRHCLTCRTSYIRSYMRCYRTNHKQKCYGKQPFDRIANLERIQWLRDNGIHLDILETYELNLPLPDDFVKKSSRKPFGRVKDYKSNITYELLRKPQLVTDPTCIICDKKRKLVK